jgi:hypothetical protein
MTSITKVTGVSIKELTDKKIKIYPCISIGTLISKSGRSWIDGINIKAELVDNDSAFTHIRLLTTLRPEHYFIAGIFILFLILLPRVNETTYDIILNWLSVHIWVQVVCRIQEELLIRKLTKGLRLAKM